MVEHVCDDALPIVVVNLDAVIALQPREMLEKKGNQVTLHLDPKRRRVLKLVLAIQKRCVANGSYRTKDGKAHQKPIAPRGIESLIWTITSDERSEMHRNVLELPVRKRALIGGDNARDVVGLIMKQERQKVVPLSLIHIWSTPSPCCSRCTPSAAIASATSRGSSSRRTSPADVYKRQARARRYRCSPPRSRQGAA